MPRKVTHKHWRADDSADGAAILPLTIAGIVFASSMLVLLVPLVDAALSSIATAIPDGTALALGHTTICRWRGARESKDLHSGAPGACGYILISYGLFVDEWENLRRTAAPVPKKREAMFRPEARNSDGCGGSAGPDKRLDSRPTRASPKRAPRSR